MILEDLFVAVKENIKKVVKYAVVGIVCFILGFVLSIVITCGSNADGRGVQGVREYIGAVRVGITAAEIAQRRAESTLRQIRDGLDRSENSIDKLEAGARRFAELIQGIREREGAGALDLSGRDSDIKRRYYLFGS